MLHVSLFECNKYIDPELVLPVCILAQQGFFFKKNTAFAVCLIHIAHGKEYFF
jgi:hypothetical protein